MKADWQCGYVRSRWFYRKKWLYSGSVVGVIYEMLLRMAKYKPLTEQQYDDAAFALAYRYSGAPGNTHNALMRGRYDRGVFTTEWPYWSRYREILNADSAKREQDRYGLHFKQPSGARYRWDGMNILCHDPKGGFWFNSNKEGGGSQWSMKRMSHHSLPVTKICTCTRCGFRSTPKRLPHRYDEAYVYLTTIRERSEEEYLTKREMDYRLCNKCWNKIRPLVKAQREADEIKQLSNRIYREALQWRRENQSEPQQTCATSLPTQSNESATAQ